MECFHLTKAELAIKHAEGWDLIGGPYLSQEECLSNCGSGSGSGSYILTCPQCPDGISPLMSLSIGTPEMLSGEDCVDAACKTFTGNFLLGYNPLGVVITQGLSYYCVWETDVTSPTCDFGTTDAPTWQLAYLYGFVDPSLNNWYLILPHFGEPPSGPAVYMLSGDWDCSGTNTFNYIPTSADNECLTWPATATVTVI